MRREYKTGTQWCAWRWKDILWAGELYLRRLIIFQCPLFSIMLHWIKQPDKQRHLHDHPVSMLSIILSGGYVELRDDGHHPRKYFNWIPAKASHRITMISEWKPCITLCIAGPRTREWGFYTEHGWMRWQEYHELYDSSTS